jgi:hypothetical protein
MRKDDLDFIGLGFLWIYMAMGVMTLRYDGWYIIIPTIAFFASFIIARRKADE